ncbi:hypothetical protein [Arthrobacter sp. A2-55]|uniref:hypothetical protein n=1 Tax=Arthrobacter sp. A2-55 TaxID=2897337 RepID=UPI0021CDB7E0|nr:hypothetical protein [Arthrobacter sp. A2-55]MCU6481433.1 hypothetical protein [Arthrobacter sp. A2-55]
MKRCVVLTLLDPVVAGDVAASQSGSFSLQPFLVFVIIAVVLLANFAKAASRKKRARNASPYAAQPVRPAQAGRPGQSSRPGQQGIAHQAAPAAYIGTLLNGVPMKNYDAAHGQQTTGFANERMKAEAELKRQLDALDAARRAGQVTAEQYAAHREAIFRNF